MYNKGMCWGLGEGRLGTLHIPSSILMHGELKQSINFELRISAPPQLDAVQGQDFCCRWQAGRRGSHPAHATGTSTVSTGRARGKLQGRYTGMELSLEGRGGGVEFKYVKLIE